MVSPCRALAASDSSPSKSFAAEGQRSTLKFSKVICVRLTQIQPDPYLCRKKKQKKKQLVTFSVFHPPLKTRAVAVISAVASSTPLSEWARLQSPPRAQKSTHTHTRAHGPTYRMRAHMRNAVAGVPRLVSPRVSTGCLPVAPGLNLLDSTCVSGQSPQGPSPRHRSPCVCCVDSWGAGTWMQEISTSQIRLMNPQLKLLAEESH